MGASSLYVAHIISTVEGGIVTTDRADYADVLRSLRSHGRACSCESCVLNIDTGSCAKRFRYGTDIRFIFERVGFSAKMNELEAAIGLGSLERYGEILSRRRENLHYLMEGPRSFAGPLETIRKDRTRRSVPTTFPVILGEKARFSRDEFVGYLKERGIDTRTLFSSIPTQCPGYRDLGFRIGDFPNAEHIGDRGIHIGVHQGLGREDCDYTPAVMAIFSRGKWRHGTLAPGAGTPPQMPAGHGGGAILAGGAGVRLREAVRDLPKPMAPVGGRPFLGYLIDQLVHWDVRDIVLATGYKSEVVETHFGDGSSHGAKLRYSVEARPMGTGGALRDALRMVRGDRFLLLNGDSFLDADLAELAEFDRGHCGVGTIALVERPDTSRYGRVTLDDRGRILSMREKGIAGPGLIGMAASTLWSREIWRMIGPGTVSLENDVVPGLLPLGVFGKIVRGYFVDIGIPEAYDTACREFARLRPCPNG